MKKLLILIFGLFLYISAHAQIEYPRYEIDTCGEKVVVLTIQQAQCLDNSTDLLFLFEKLNSQISNYDSICLKVVNQKDSVISSQSIDIKKLKEDAALKDRQIYDLSKVVMNDSLQKIGFKTEINNKDKEINLRILEIKHAKRDYAIGGGAIGIIVGLVVGILLMHH